MTLCASLAIILFPMCGEGLSVSGIKIGKEPEITVVQCENCKTTLQVTQHRITGKMKVERAKKN